MREVRSRGLLAGAAATLFVATFTMRDAPTPAATPTPRPVLAEPRAPAGTRWLITRGIGVAVPVKWWTGSHTCGAPEEDALIVEDDQGDGDCMGGLHPHLNVVRTGWAWRKVVVDPVARDVVVDGVAARRITGRMKDQVYGMWAGQYVQTLEVQSRGAVILVMTDDPAVADRVLDTARIWTGTDPRGCPILRDDLYATTLPQRPGAQQQLVPDGAVEASVCRYKYGVVLTSRRLGPNRTTELATRFNWAPRGFEERHDDVPDRHAVVATFRYPTGPDVVVFVHVAGNRDVGASNGAVETRLTIEVANYLHGVVGTSFVNEGRLVVPR